MTSRGATGLSVDPEILSRMHDLFAAAVRGMRANLLARIGTEVPVRFGDVSYVPHGELADHFHDEGHALYVRFALQPSDLTGVLAIDGALLSRLMGLMLGEDPWAPPTPFQWRPPTRMDLNMARRIAEDVFDGLAEAMGAQAQQIEVLDISASNRIDLPYPRTSLLLDATLDLGPPEEPYGLMTLALPLAFASAAWPETTPKKTTSPGGLSRVLPLPVTVVAELGRAHLTLGAIQDLRPGDTLKLGPPREARVTIADRAVLAAEAGTVDTTRSVRVLRRAG